MYITEPLTTDFKCNRRISLGALVGANHFEDRFCADKKGGMVEVRWTSSLSFSTNRHRNCTLPL